MRMILSRMDSRKRAPRPACFMNLLLISMGSVLLQRAHGFAVLRPVLQHRAVAPSCIPRYYYSIESGRAGRSSSMGLRRRRPKMQMREGDGDTGVEMSEPGVKLNKGELFFLSYTFIAAVDMFRSRTADQAAKHERNMFLPI